MFVQPLGETSLMKLNNSSLKYSIFSDSSFSGVHINTHLSRLTKKKKKLTKTRYVCTASPFS